MCEHARLSQKLTQLLVSFDLELADVTLVYPLLHALRSVHAGAEGNLSVALAAQRCDCATQAHFQLDVAEALKILRDAHVGTDTEIRPRPTRASLTQVAKLQLLPERREMKSEVQ